MNSKIEFLFINLLVILISFLITYNINLKKNKKVYNLQELALFMNDNCYHVHHFISIGTIIIFMIIARSISKNSFYLLISFLLGICLEDLLFRDWSIIKNNCHKSRLINLMRNTIDVYSEFN